MDDQYLSMDEAAALARVTRRTVYRWWRDGLIPPEAVRWTPSGRPAFHRAAVELRVEKPPTAGPQPGGGGDVR